MTNNVLVGVKDIGQRLFGGYAELLRIPHSITTATIRWRAR